MTTVTSTANTANTNADRAIKSITRSGTTFTATRYNGSTFTFTQQDNDTDRVYQKTFSWNIPANSSWWVTGSFSVAVSGWTPIGVLCQSMPQGRYILGGQRFEGNTFQWGVAAVDCKAITAGTGWVTILYTK